MLLDPHAGTCGECGASLEYAMGTLPGPGKRAGQVVYLCPNRGEEWHSTPDLNKALEEPPDIDEIAEQIDQILREQGGPGWRPR